MNLRREVSRIMVANGFICEGRTHLLRVDTDLSYWVDTGLPGKGQDIAPYVGIRSTQVENLVTDLMGVPRDRWAATVGANVGNVLGEGYRSWEPPTEPLEVFETISLALGRLRPFLALERLPNVWTLADVRGPAWRYREIAILLCLRQLAEVPGRLAAAEAVFCKHDDEVCEQFRGFANRVKTYLDV